MTTLIQPESVVLSEPCGHCGFVFQQGPRLTAGLRDTAVCYQQVGYVLTDPVRLIQQHPDRPWTGFDCLVHVRDHLHYYANHLGRFTAAGPPICGHLNPGPAQAYAQDYSGVMIGLAANMRRLGQVIETFPSLLWGRPGVMHGRSISAIDIGNYAVHEAAHHLVDLELLLEPGEKQYLDLARRKAGLGPEPLPRRGAEVDHSGNDVRFPNPADTAPPQSEVRR